MFNKILVPLDGSEFSDRILDPIRLLIQSGDVEQIYLLQVLDPDCPYQELNAAHDRLLTISKHLAPRSVQVDAIAIRGDPAAEILRAARNLEPTLIAMATHGRSGFSRLVRGSVTERVLRQSRVPLLLANSKSLESGVPWDAKRFQRVLVPLDGSSGARQILPLVEALGSAHDSRVKLLRSYSPASSPEIFWGLPLLKQSMEPSRARLEAAGIPVELKVTYAGETEQILKAASQADLVAMATRGRSGVSRWLNGSVAESVIRQCPTPVLVYRAETKASDERGRRTAGGTTSCRARTGTPRGDSSAPGRGAAP